MIALLLVILAGFMQAAGSFTESGLAPSHGTTLALGYVLLSAHLAGRLVRRIRLPRVTAYLAIGVITGPQGLGLLTESLVDGLGLVNGVAIALIALSAGLEIEIAGLRPLMRTIATISGIAVLGTAVLLAGACFVFQDAFGFAPGMPLWQALCLSAVLGVIMVAQSPAVVVALRDETNADGPVTRTILAVVVLADLVVVVLFAGTSAIAKAAFGAEGALAAAAATLIWKVMGSVGLGILMGGILLVYVRLVAGKGGLFVLTVALVTAEVGGRLELDPLLAGLVAGLVVRNATSAHATVGRSVAAAAMPVYAVFFAVAGAGIHLSALGKLALPLVTIALVRAVGLVGGTYLAGRWSGAPPEVARLAGWGLVPQAGLALALTVLFARVFPEYATTAASLTVSLVALNELCGPVLLRWALGRSGEIGQRERADEPPSAGGPGPAHSTSGTPAPK